MVPSPGVERMKSDQVCEPSHRGLTPTPVYAKSLSPTTPPTPPPPAAPSGPSRNRDGPSAGWPEPGGGGGGASLPGPGVGRARRTPFGGGGGVGPEPPGLPDVSRLK